MAAITPAFEEAYIQMMCEGFERFQDLGELIVVDEANRLLAEAGFGDCEFVVSPGKRLVIAPRENPDGE